MTTPIRILVADAHPIVRAGLNALVGGQPDLRVVGEAGDGEAAVALAAGLDPDVVVGEVAVLGGAELIRRLRADRAGRGVLVLTACEEPRRLREVLAAGAGGYVLKRSAPEQLLQAVRSVAGGGTYLDPELPGGVAGRQDGAGLSDREEEVLTLLALGYANKEIARGLGLSVKTVETYKSRSMNKLKVRTRPGLVRYALDRGWLDVAAPMNAVGV
jgi:two-component system response regulator NreC